MLDTHYSKMPKPKQTRTSEQKFILNPLPDLPVNAQGIPLD